MHRSFEQKISRAFSEAAAEDRGDAGPSATLLRPSYRPYSSHCCQSSTAEPEGYSPVVRTPPGISTEAS